MAEPDALIQTVHDIVQRHGGMPTRLLQILREAQDSLTWLSPETLDAAIRLGATHIGLVHYEPSPRHVDLKTANCAAAPLDGAAVQASDLLSDGQAETGARARLVEPATALAQL